MLQSRIAMADSPAFKQVSKLILDALRIWRQPLGAKAGAFVVYTGLGLLLPGFRDLLLVGLPVIINWVLEKWKLSLRVPPLESVPWWAGLILVGAGLSFLYFHARQKRVVIKVTVTKTEVIIEMTGPAEVVDNPGLQQLFQKALEKAAQAPPPGSPTG